MLTVGTGIGLTTRFVKAVAVPPGPTTLKVYVVFVVGETVSVPETYTELPFKVAVIELVELHTTFAELPEVIGFGDTDIVAVGIKIIGVTGGII